MKKEGRISAQERTKKDGEQNCSPFSSGRRNRTSGLWVMSPTSYHCSTPRCILNSCAKILLFFNSAKFSAEKSRKNSKKVQKGIKCSFLRQFSRRFLHKIAQMCNFANELEMQLIYDITQRVTAQQSYICPI